MSAPRSDLTGSPALGTAARRLGWLLPGSGYASVETLRSEYARLRRALFVNIGSYVSYVGGFFISLPLGAITLTQYGLCQRQAHSE